MKDTRSQHCQEMAKTLLTTFQDNKQFLMKKMSYQNNTFRHSFHL
jgi:hypothetical protein